MGDDGHQSFFCLRFKGGLITFLFAIGNIVLVGTEMIDFEVVFSAGEYRSLSTDSGPVKTGSDVAENDRDGKTV